MKKTLLNIVRYFFILLEKLKFKYNNLKLYLLGVKKGKNLIYTGNSNDISNIMLVKPENIVIGNNVYIGKGFYCNAYNNVEIGDNVMISHYVGIISANHNINNGLIEYNEYENNNPIKIGNGTWIGYNVTILPGVIIGKNVIIGAMSVVTKSIEDNSIVVGNPAKIIK